LTQLRPFLVSTAVNKNACTTLLTSSGVVSNGSSSLTSFGEHLSCVDQGDVDDDSVSSNFHSC